ncbi:MAG TPA: ABC transporter ATP-binding protein [Acidimicrobiales bacterium]|nr:ABC transporter ATP-binding protein [Acidimicrobiales bacterium]
MVALTAEFVGAVSTAALLLFGGSLVAELTASPAPSRVRDVSPEVIGLGVALLVSGLAAAVVRESRFLVVEEVARHTQREIVEITSSVDYSMYERQDFNDLLDRSNQSASSSSHQMVFDLLGIFNTVVTSVVLVGLLATQVPAVLPALLLLALPFLWAARASARLAFVTTYELTPQDRLRRYLYRALSTKRHGKELRVFGLAPPLEQRWDELCDERMSRMYSLSRRRLLLQGAAVLAGAALVVSVLTLVVRAAILGQITLAEAAVAIVALQQLSSRARAVSGRAGSLRESTLFLDDFDAFRALRVETVETDPGPMPPFETLRVDQMSFTYPGTEREVLHDVSIELHRGEIVALVGVSGSGKTTLSHLVAGLYQPTRGRITWDGVDVSTVAQATYWRSMGVVFQDFVCYELSARENIAFSDHRRLDELEAIRSAARRADIAPTLEQLAHGYETMLSRSYERGADLSVGQWQRVAIARAFFREARLLILDEPAAALDAVAEQALYKRLVELCVDRTVLLVSHRFSTVRLADRIYVMQDGRVVETGTHAELLALDGHYAQLFRVQAAGYL